ncbi:MAG: 4'-phosphopantetheinyl transferase superfamily protein [Gloeomargarita sp. GMQP_bins_120]
MLAEQPLVSALPDVGVAGIEVYHLEVQGLGAEGTRALAALLTPADYAEMAGLSCPQKRHRFSLSRGILRWLLGRYLGVSPQDLCLVRNRWGKLVLPDDSLHFNLSHSGTKLVVAVSRLYRVGIDLEQVRPLACLDRLVKRYCTRREQHLWQTLPPSQQTRFFLQTWTAKEAYAKGWGTGLAGLLRHFSGLETTLGTSLGLGGGWPAQWQPLALGPDYVGALCWGPILAATA